MKITVFVNQRLTKSVINGSADGSSDWSARARIEVYDQFKLEF